MTEQKKRIKKVEHAFDESITKRMIAERVEKYQIQLNASTKKLFNKIN